MSPCETLRRVRADCDETVPSRPPSVDEERRRNQSSLSPCGIDDTHQRRNVRSSRPLTEHPRLTHPAHIGQTHRAPVNPARQDASTRPRQPRAGRRYADTNSTGVTSRVRTPPPSGRPVRRRGRLRSTMIGCPVSACALLHACTTHAVPGSCFTNSTRSCRRPRGQRTQRRLAGISAHLQRREPFTGRPH